MFSVVHTYNVRVEFTNLTNVRSSSLGSFVAGFLVKNVVIAVYLCNTQVYYSDIFNLIK